jgi:hypothetical protein
MVFKSRILNHKRAGSPEVGIIFVYKGHLFLEGSTLREAANYGGLLGHANDHFKYWQDLQRSGLVPTDVEYDEVPRGRVGYDPRNKQFKILIDKCILKDKRMVDKIENDFRLPSANTVVELDSHYKCPGCLRASKTKKQLEQEEADWDF